MSVVHRWDERNQQRADRAEGRRDRGPTRFRAVVGDDGSTFRLEPLPSGGTKLLAGLLVALDIVGVLLLVAAAALLMPGSTQDLYTGSIWLIAAVMLLWICFHGQFRKPRVRITQSQLEARGAFGRTRRINRGDIASLDLKARTYGRSALPRRVPYTTDHDGKGFWLDALAGDANDRPVDPTQMEVLRQIRSLLGVGGSDA